MNETALPDIESNFTPVPHAFFRLVFSEGMSLCGLTAALYCIYRGYGWQSGQGAVSAESLAADTTLTISQAVEGLESACASGLLIRLPSLSGQQGRERSMYLLNTADNARFVAMYCEGEQYIEPDETGDRLDEPPGLSPVPSSAASTTTSPPVSPVSRGCVPSGRAAVETDVPDDTAARSGTASIATDDGEAAPAVDHSHEGHETGGASAFPDGAAPVRGKLSEGGRPRTTVNGPEIDDELPFEKKTVEMLVRLLGRPIGKSEKERLKDLGASDAELISAMSSLLGKTTNVYSSDLVIYEYERLKARDRQAAKYEKARAERLAQIERMRKCTRCSGLGYVFIGVNNIRECECRKKRD